MKSLVLVLATLTSLSAHALESHYGRVKSHGLTHTCVFTNNTGYTLDLKYVAFNISDNGEVNYDVQKRIDKRVQPGATVTTSVDQSLAYNATSCRYIAR